jgi:hypothetical protein
VQCHQFAGDRKTQAQPAMPLRVAAFRLPEPLEDVRREIGRDALSGIRQPKLWLTT